MEDFVIDACCWYVDAAAPESKRRALEHFRDCYTVLLDFLREQSLLRDPDFGRHIHHWINFEIRKSDLTEEGLELFKRCHRNWGPAFGEDHTKPHLVQWRRRLSKMRGAA
jgi:hypothetical protein